MKIDLYLYHPRQEEMPARARQTERGGFDGLFVAESTSDPFQCLAVASPHTSRVTLGTSVALAFPRSPMLTAVAAWDLQRATHGRHILGLGSQVRLAHRAAVLRPVHAAGRPAPGVRTGRAPCLGRLPG